MALANSGKPWTKPDFDLVLNMLAIGRTIDDCAVAIKRGQNAVLVKLSTKVKSWHRTGESFDQIATRLKVRTDFIQVLHLCERTDNTKAMEYLKKHPIVAAVMPMAQVQPGVVVGNRPTSSPLQNTDQRMVVMREKLCELMLRVEELSTENRFLHMENEHLRGQLNDKQNSLQNTQISLINNIENYAKSLTFSDDDMADEIMKSMSGGVGGSIGRTIDISPEVDTDTIDDILDRIGGK